MWTQSLTRPVSRTVRLLTGDSTGAPGLFAVAADTFPFGYEDATPGSRACVPVRAPLGRVRRAGLPGAFWCASPFLWPFCPSSLFRPLRAAVARVLIFCSFPFLFSPLSCPRCVRPFMLPGPGCPRPWRSSFDPSAPDPPPFFWSCFVVLRFLPPRALRPCSRWLWRSLVPNLGCPWSWRCAVSPHHHLFFCFVSCSLPPPVWFVCLCSLFGLFFVFFFLCILSAVVVLLPSVPRALALCGCHAPLTPPLFFSPFFPPFLCSPCPGLSVLSGPVCPGPRRLVAAHPPPAAALSLLFLFYFFVLRSRFSLVPAALVALGLCTAWLRFFVLLHVRPCVWCVRCVLGLSPPPPPTATRVSLCLVSFCLVPRSVAGCFVWFAAFCGVFRCRVVLVLCCVVCCRAVLLVLSLAVSRGRCFPPFSLVSCSAFLCRAVLCGALMCVMPSRVVVWFIVLCVGLLRGVVWLSGPLRCVGFSCLSPPSLCCCPLLLLPAPLPWPLVVFSPWVRCCVGLLCRLSYGVLLSCWWCPVASFALASDMCRCLWLLGVRCLVWLPAVVFYWRALARVFLPGRVACCPAVCCGLLWRPAPLCRVLSSVVLCCRVVPCCGALLSVLPC